MISVQKLGKVFGEQVAVEGLSFDLPAASTLALVGTSGSGKTTTLKMLNRLIEPSTGSIFVNGENIRQQALTEMRRKMGYVIQKIGLFPHWTVLQNIGVVPRLLGWPADKIQQRAAELLERLDLSPDIYLNRYPTELSGGQQQRVGIARALTADPPIILMDEPFSALDPITRAGLRRDFLELETLRDKTIVMVTHDTQEAFELANYIAVMDQGKLQQFGTPTDLLFRPANAFVESFLADQQLALAMQILRLHELPTTSQQTTSDNKVQFSPDTTFASAQQQLLDFPAVNVGGQVEGSAQYFQGEELVAEAWRRLKFKYQS